MKVSELGEFPLIDILAGMVEESRNDSMPAWQNLIVGIGDDCAAWRVEPDHVQIGKIDALFENIHFKLDTATWRELGWKVLAINMSDIAAAGGMPRYALVNLALPPDTEVENIKDLYRGMLELAGKFGVAIAGGNISRAGEVSIVLSLTGVAREGRLLSRSVARPGHQIAVTGSLGGSAGGLRLLSQNLDLDIAARDSLRTAFMTPFPRVAESLLLVESGVRCCIDISDGLVQDMGHICEQSGVRGRIHVDRVPRHPAITANFPMDSVLMALSGGEDYELLFTASPETMAKVNRALTCPVTVIGEIVEGAGVELLDSRGRVFTLPQTGWDHFKAGRRTTK